jgi:hypothetical protein
VVLKTMMVSAAAAAAASSAGNILVVCVLLSVLLHFLPRLLFLSMFRNYFGSLF